ncbi:MAG: IS4 family transposase [Gammaproteobacteria bacterium]|nr:IS4 family transposase [Planctomycetaceae bacterium]MCP5157788.1 IS4 family transposase [Gammaproteobacteria bacterium]MCB9951364.1 IS4 family transposase [Planctomycetaceae bacterium]MCB9951367.1 IS4 family transposase [Planctomycetaceae bacterium]MCB9951547.1 IS4 family transposase [Planctomycetaceae bacterium]
MGRKSRKGVEKTTKLQGLKYFQLIDDLLAGLRGQATARDKAGNRQLFCDQYIALLLLYFFNPTVTSLRGLQKFTTLEKVQKLCGVKPTSLGSLSEAARVFDPAVLEPIIAQLAAQARTSPSAMPPAQQAALAGLTAVDSSLLKALPRMAWALWQDAEHRAIKMHVAFGVFEQAPLEVAVTHGNGAEREQLRNMVQPGGFYVADRGYANNAMFREFDAQNVRFLIRVQENTTFEVQAEQPLSDADSQAGVVRDLLVRRLGTEKHNRLLEEPLRIVEIRGTEPDQVWILATNARDLPAELIAVAYRYRWQIELFFRWLKCVLGCRHLLSHCESGVTLQVYAAVIASLLISLWTGSKPSKRTWEMLCHYFSGWATLEELHQHLNLPSPRDPPRKS